MPGEKKYKVKANEFLFSFTHNEIEKADLVKLSPTEYHLIKDHHSVVASITNADLHEKKLEVEVAGETYSIEIGDELDLVLEKMGFGIGKGKQLKEVKAPMPGLVLEIAVINGQDVNEGDKILILEAMKMENNIMVHTSARIKRITVEAGQAVEKGQVLVELE